PAGDGGQIDVTDERPTPPAKRDDPLDQLAIHVADASEYGEEDQHRHQYEGERYLRREPDPEPDNEQRRKNDARDGVEHRHYRRQQFGNQRDQRADDAEHDPNHDAEREPDNRGRKSGFKVWPDATVRKQIVKRRRDGARHRHEQGIEHASAPGRLPDDEQEAERDQLAQP